MSGNVNFVVTVILYVDPLVLEMDQKVVKSVDNITACKVV